MKNTWKPSMEKMKSLAENSEYSEAENQSEIVDSPDKSSSKNAEKLS